MNLKKHRKKKKIICYFSPSPLPSQPPCLVRENETGCLDEMTVRFVLYSPEQVSSASQIVTLRLSSTKRAGAAVPMASAALYKAPLSHLPGGHLPGAVVSTDPSKHFISNKQPQCKLHLCTCPLAALLSGACLGLKLLCR